MQLSELIIIGRLASQFFRENFGCTFKLVGFGVKELICPQKIEKEVGVFRKLKNLSDLKSSIYKSNDLWRSYSDPCKKHYFYGSHKIL